MLHTYKQVMSHERIMRYVDKLCYCVSVASFWRGSDCHESRHTRMQWVISHINESCHAWRNHVTTYQSLIFKRIWDSHPLFHYRTSHITYDKQWVMSHMKKSRHNVWVSDVQRGRESHQSLHTWRSHGTYDYNESCHTWTSHVTVYRLQVFEGV